MLTNFDHFFHILFQENSHLPIWFFYKSRLWLNLEIKEKYLNVGFRAVVEVLLAAGVDVNTRTSAGTAMHEAALCGKMEVVRALLDRGVDLGIRDSRQNTVLDLLGQFPPHVTQDITAVIKSAYPLRRWFFFSRLDATSRVNELCN